MHWPDPVTLAGPQARLEPLSRGHLEGLCAATRDGELWKLWYTLVPSPEGMAANIDATHRRVEIGSTWTAASAQRTGLNTQCKRLLLGHAFEALGCIAVEFRTHRLNTQSRRAIERLGAQLDGMLRSHQRMPDGTLRDTAVYSITAAEWPTIRTHLDWQLARPR